jgi:hypothetical protein
MSRPRNEDLDEPKTPLEVAKEAIVREIKKKPPPEILTPLVNALSKLLAVENKISEGDSYMGGFDEDPPLPTTKPPT